MTQDIIIIGAGGHGRVLLDALQMSGTTVRSFTNHNKNLHGSEIDGTTVIGDDKKILKFDVKAVLLVNGVGSTGNPARRVDTFNRLREAGYHFTNVIHSGACVSSRARLGEGVQVMAGALVQTGAEIGANSIVNTGATVDHDSRIGTHVHIAPGAMLSGDVTVGNGTHIGTGACVIQGITIGANSLIAAGAVGVENVGNQCRVDGNPAQEMK